MSSIRIKFLDWKTYKDGTHPIVIQVVHNRKRQIITTGISAKENQWDDENKELKSSYSNSARANGIIAKKLADTREVLLELQGSGKPFSLAQLMDKLSIIKSNESVFQYMERQSNEQMADGKYGNGRLYKAVLGVLKNFREEKDLEFVDLDYKMLKKFESYLNQEGVRPNTLSNYMRTLRAIYNRAIKDNVVDESLYPFKKYKISYKPTQKRAITKEQIDAIRDADLKNDKKLVLARDIFLFSFYTRGMNLVDIIYLKVSDLTPERIRYSRQKTNQQFSIKRTEKINRIISKYNELSDPESYVFPIIKREGAEAYLDYQNFKRSINRSLKDIAGVAKIDVPLTTNVARHSWATIAKRKGFTTAVISEGLGHETESTTQIYLDSFENDVLDKANDKITE